MVKLKLVLQIFFKRIYNLKKFLMAKYQVYHFTISILIVFSNIRLKAQADVARGLNWFRVGLLGVTYN